MEEKLTDEDLIQGMTKQGGRVESEKAFLSQYKYWVIGTTMIFLVLVLFGLIAHIKYSNDSDQGQITITTTTTLTGTSTPTLTVTPSPTQIFANGTEFISDYFPGLAFRYPRGWELQYLKHDTQGTPYYYSDTCNDECFGIRLRKNGGSLKMGLVTASDNNFFNCTNTHDLIEISEGWRRVFGIDNFYLPVRALNEDHTVTEQEADGYGYGNFSDNWSVVNGKEYTLCYFGDGAFLTKKRDEEASVLMENPTLSGNLTEAILREADLIVSTIKGVRTK